MTRTVTAAAIVAGMMMLTPTSGHAQADIPTWCHDAPSHLSPDELNHCLKWWHEDGIGVAQPEQQLPQLDKTGAPIFAPATAAPRQKCPPGNPWWCHGGR